jgi:hypothetical protein
MRELRLFDFENFFEQGGYMAACGGQCGGTMSHRRSAFNAGTFDAIALAVCG